MAEAGVVILIIAIGAYAGLGLLLYSQQSRLIHLPGIHGRALTATPADIGLDWENVRLTTEDDVTLHGWYLPAPAEPHFTLLFFHGNASNISHRLETLATFHEIGVATLIIDYRGFGQSEGQPSEEGLYRDAEAAWRYLVEERDIAPRAIIASGRSLGAAVAAHLAVHRPVGGLVLESAFTSIPDIAAERYPMFPVRWLVRVEYPTRSLVERVEVPVLVVHSTEDDLIPYRHGQAIYGAAPSPKQFLALRGGHNDGFLQSQSVYVAGLSDWLNRLAGDDR